MYIQTKRGILLASCRDIIHKVLANVGLSGQHVHRMCSNIHDVLVMQIAEADAIESMRLGNMFRALPSLVQRSEWEVEESKKPETEDEKREREKRKAGIASIRSAVDLGPILLVLIFRHVANIPRSRRPLMT